jgi:hypothetical protein
MANRPELEQALNDGYAVLVSGHGETIRKARQLPPDPDPASGRPRVTGVVVRDPDGRLTREGMEHAVRTGGSVLMAGEVHTDLSALPSAADLARDDERRASQERDNLLKQRAALDAELAKLAVPGKQGQETPPAARGPSEEQQRLAAEAERLRQENEQLRRDREQLLAAVQEDEGQQQGRKKGR